MREISLHHLLPRYLPWLYWLPQWTKKVNPILRLPCYPLKISLARRKLSTSTTIEVTETIEITLSLISTILACEVMINFLIQTTRMCSTLPQDSIYTRVKENFLMKTWWGLLLMSLIKEWERLNLILIPLKHMENMSATMKSLEIHIGQLANALKDHNRGQFPSNI